MGIKRTIANLLIVVMICPLMSGCIFMGDTANSNSVDYGIPGGLALACLRDSQYKELILEIDYESGYQPQQETLDLLKQRLNDVCNNPKGVSIELELTSFQHTGSWNVEDIRDKSKELTSGPSLNGDVLKWHYLFPSGKYSDENVLGVAVDASTVMIFLDSISEAENCILLVCRPTAEEIEKSVTIHETGHLLGLVNTVYTSDIDHEDESHPNHSNNEDSVMYWAIETADIGNILTGELPNEFDSADKSDLEKLASGELIAHSQLWDE